ncbi:UNVERIFIED_ORG: hypothetical protein DFO49_0494 [Herbaspirillum seropedicae]
MSKNSRSPTTTTVNRSAVTGKFVTERYAQSHPRTTVTERVKVQPASPKRK